MESTWVFPKIGVPQNGLFLTENPIKMDDLGGTTIFGNTHMEKVDATSCENTTSCFMGASQTSSGFG